LRERESRQAAVLEQFTACDYIFRCIVCDRIRKEEERHDGSSSICIRCIEEAEIN